MEEVRVHPLARFLCWHSWSSVQIP